MGVRGPGVSVFGLPVGNELVFVLSFVSTNNTDVETAEQFILLYTRCVCDFSGLINFSQKLRKLEENVYIVPLAVFTLMQILQQSEIGLYKRNCAKNFIL